MDIHDHEQELLGSVKRPEPTRRPEREAPAGLEQAIAARRPDVLDVKAIHHLQRSAGNESVGSFLEGEDESPVKDVIRSGGGRPLDGPTRSFMENRLGHDFSDVRVHDDGRAGESARAVSAQAYTVGSEIVFQSGKYSPETDGGKRMLAHELTHVVQQRSGPVDGSPAPGGINISHPSDRFEQAAERSADHVMTSAPASIAPVTSAPVAMQRRGEEEEELQMLAVQRAQPEEEEEEPVQATAVQREEEQEPEETA